MTGTEALERRIDELCAENERLRGQGERLFDKTLELGTENAKLREELEQWHRLTAGIELPEYPITEFKPKDLERENAELRELVWDMRTCIGHACMCEFCPLFITSEDMGERRCIADVKARMRELGVEVDG